jgi:hypothetical protein
MSAINDGGPAFPGFNYTEGHGNIRRSPDGLSWETWSEGMSLRDWFASRETLSDWDDTEAVMSKHMAEALAGEPQPEGGWSSDAIGMFRFEAKWRAALRYIRADAMLAAREKSAKAALALARTAEDLP